MIDVAFSIKPGFEVWLPNTPDSIEAFSRNFVAVSADWLGFLIDKIRTVSNPIYTRFSIILHWTKV